MKKIFATLFILLCLSQMALTPAYLNPAFFRGKVAAGGGGGGTVTAVDNFTRADANPISNPMSDGVSTWVTPVGASSAMQIVSHDLTGTGGGQSIAAVASPTFPDNQAATNIISSDSNFGIEQGPMVRVQSGNAGGYILYIASTTSLQLYLVTDDGTMHFTALGSPLTVSGGIQLGDRLVLSVSGGTFNVIYNGAVLETITDSTFAHGQPGTYGNPSRFSAGFGATSIP